MTIPVYKLVQFLPQAVLNHLFVLGLQRVMATELAHGHLDFLHDKCCAIVFTDVDMTLTIALRNRHFVCRQQPVDVKISAETGTFFLLATRQIDPDTLFFQRRLSLDGDTELGLQIKNFLDQFELDEQHIWLEKVMQWLVTINGDKHHPCQS